MFVVLADGGDYHCTILGYCDTKEIGEEYLKTKRHCSPMGFDKWTNGSGVEFSVLEVQPLKL